jgi:hypothetical protein
MKGALGWVEGGGAAGDGHAEARRGRRRRGGRWGEGGRKRRLCRVGAPAGWLGESCSGLQQSKGLGVSGSLPPATGWGTGWGGWLRRTRGRRGEEVAALPRWGASGLAWGKLQRAAAVQGLGGFGVTAPGYRVGDWVGWMVEEGEGGEMGRWGEGGGSGGFAALGRQRAGLGKAAAGCSSPRDWGFGVADPGYRVGGLGGCGVCASSGGRPRQRPRRVPPPSGQRGDRRRGCSRAAHTGKG